MVNFHTKNPIWVQFRGSWNEKFWYILWPFGNVVVAWYITYSPFWYILPQKIRQPWCLGVKNINRSNLHPWYKKEKMTSGVYLCSYLENSQFYKMHLPTLAAPFSFPMRLCCPPVHLPRMLSMLLF
jgi:hypothetical protein